MAKLDPHQKALIDAILADGEADPAELRRLAMLVYTGGKTHAELRAELEADIDVRVPINIAPLLITPDRLRNDVERHEAIIAQRVARNNAIMQGVALTILGAAATGATGGGFSLATLKPMLAGLLALLGMNDGDAIPGVGSNG